MLSKLEGLAAQQSAVFHLQYYLLVWEFGHKFPEFQESSWFWYVESQEQKPLIAAFPNI